MPYSSLDFQQAKANHLLFKSRLRALLYDETPENESAILSQYACAMGRWIYSHALIAYESVPEVQKLEEVHAAIHTTARDLIALYKQGQVVEARRGLDRIEQIADELVQLLDIVADTVTTASQPTQEPSPAAVGVDEPTVTLTALLEKNERLDASLKHQAKELAEKDQIFTTIMAASPAVLWMADAHGAITYINQTWLEWTGKPLAAHVGKGWLDFLVEEDRSRVAAKFLANIASQKPYTNEFRFRRADGAIRLCAVSGKPWYTRHGTMGGYVGSCVDITEQRETEQALYQKTEHERQVLHDFFMQAPAAHCILRGPNHVFELVNPGYVELIGDRELIGKPVREAVPEVEGQGFLELLDQVFTTREAFVGKEVPISLYKGPGILKKGYINFIYQPILNQQQETDGILVFAYEVTEQVLARQRVEESEAKFRHLIEEAPVATCLLTGPDFVIEIANETMIGYWGKDASVVGKPLLEAIPELKGQATEQRLRKAIAMGQPYTAQAVHGLLMVNGVLKDNYFDANYKPLYDADGVIYGLLIMGVSVTEQVLAQQQLKASEERYRTLSAELDQQVQQRTQELQESIRDLKRSNDNLQQFAYVASHDLQEPLRKIQSFSNLLQMQYADRLGDGIDHLQRMQSAASRMSTLIRDLLTYSRISTQQEVTGWVALNQVVDLVLNDINLTIQETGAVVEVDHLPAILGDTSQLTQLFLNLLSNALKFSRVDMAGNPAIPVVRVIAQTVAMADLPDSVKLSPVAAGYYRIDVADNGIGFDEKYLSRIFQVFQRLHGRSEFAGTGIGLAICEKVAANHGGAITATSQPGQGATFSVFFPVRLAD